MSRTTRLIGLLTLFLVGLFLQPIRYARVDAGHTGIKFNYYGITDDKGISDSEVVSGAIFYNTYTRGVFEYPHYWQDAVYENISFNSLEGEPIYTDLKVVYRFRKENIPDVFDEYRLSPRELQRTIIESIVLEDLSTEAGKLSAVNIMGRDREKLLQNVTESLNNKYSYFEFQLVTFVDKLKPSENVQNAIQGVIQAQEKAKSAQARTVEIEEAAKQKIISAKADSTSRVIKAASEAKAVELVQKQLSQNPQYIQYVTAQKWDGKLPTYAGDIPMIFKGN